MAQWQISTRHGDLMRYLLGNSALFTLIKGSHDQVIAFAPSAHRKTREWISIAWMGFFMLLAYCNDHDLSAQVVPKVRWSSCIRRCMGRPQWSEAGRFDGLKISSNGSLQFEGDDSIIWFQWWKWKRSLKFGMRLTCLRYSMISLSIHCQWLSKKTMSVAIHSPGPSQGTS